MAENFFTVNIMKYPRVEGYMSDCCKTTFLELCIVMRILESHSETEAVADRIRGHLRITS
jgi:hypothetical protein